jgi:hypothetical protein
MTMSVIQCENFNCIHHSTNNQSNNSPSQCTLNSIHITHTGNCTKNENKPDSQYQTTIIEQIPFELFLPNIKKALDLDVMQEILKTVGAVQLVKVHSYPTQKQPYLNLIVLTDKGKQELVTVDYRPKIPDNTT